MSKTKVLQDSEEGFLFTDNRHMTDMERLAMLKSKAKRESANFGYMQVIKVIVLFVVVITLSYVFYKIVALTCVVGSLKKRFETLQVPLNHPTNQRQASSLHHTSWSDATGFSPPENCNCTIDHRHHRSRRSATASEGNADNVGDGSNTIGSQFKMPTHFGRHLVPFEADSVLRAGHLLRWKDVSNPTSVLSKPTLDLLIDRYLMAPVAGFYFIYSQITFNDAQTRTVGHMITTTGRCGNGRTTVLLSTEVTQMGRTTDAFGNNPRDSSYTGGVIYLSAGDLVAVMPKLGITVSMNVSQTEDNTFFGAFLVSADDNAPTLFETCR